MPGPLPNKQTRRRNAPTIPTTELPAGGRKGRPPKPPESYEFAAAARAWWKWAWTTPQAMAWDPGSKYVIARRASLEDDLAIIDNFDHFELAEILDLDDDHKRLAELSFVIGKLKGLAGGRLGILREMRELDAKLGLSPESMAKLRWKIVDEDAQESGPTAGKTGPRKLPANVTRMRAHDPAAVQTG